MNRSKLNLFSLPTIIVALAGLACGGSTPETTTPDSQSDETTTQVAEPIPAPPSGPPRFVSFPEMVRAELPSGLEVNTVRYGTLPIVNLRVVVRSGRETDPADKPGVASLVADMLQEGTQNATSAQLAQRVERLGAELSTGTDSDNLYVSIRCLEDQVDAAMAILADVLLRPSFPQDELDKLKRRELERLELSRQQPRWLAGRALNRHLYGEGHPYAHRDTNAEAIGQITRRDLVRWHRANVVPNNAIMLAVGAVNSQSILASAETALARWRPREVETVEIPDPAPRTSREVILIDRPGSAQSTIYVTNLAVARSSEDFVPLEVTNQVLGGSAASRLFLDLREARSLGYGAYSALVPRVARGPFVALASVRTDATQEATEALFEHLERITTEPVPEEELVLARRALTTNFPLQIETVGRVAWLLSDLRIHGLADDYWDMYQTEIVNTTAEEALAAAQEHIRPNEALVIVVGDASQILEGLRGIGPVTVENLDGEVITPPSE